MFIEKTRGFTIVEVLIAMVILSIGVLGLGMLQLKSMQNTQGGYLRSQAAILAYDIVDSMRANIPAVTDGDYGIAFDQATPVAVNCYSLMANCSTAQMASSDINRWRTVLGTYLPDGTGQVTTANLGTTTQVTVEITWFDPYTAASGPELLSLVSELDR